MRRKNHEFPADNEVYECHDDCMGRKGASAHIPGGLPLLREARVLPGAGRDIHVQMHRMRGGNLKVSIFSIVRRGMKAAPWGAAAGKFRLDNFVFSHSEWLEILKFVSNHSEWMKAFKKEEVRVIERRGYVYLYAMNKAGKLYRIAWTHEVIARGGWK